MAETKPMIAPSATTDIMLPCILKSMQRMRAAAVFASQAASSLQMLD
jgi:hypothetical protein